MVLVSGGVWWRDGGRRCLRDLAPLSSDIIISCVWVCDWQCSLQSLIMQYSVTDLLSICNSLCSWLRDIVAFDKSLSKNGRAKNPKILCITCIFLACYRVAAKWYWSYSELFLNALSAIALGQRLAFFMFRAVVSVLAVLEQHVTFHSRA